MLRSTNFSWFYVKPAFNLRSCILSRMIVLLPSNKVLCWRNLFHIHCARQFNIHLYLNTRTEVDSELTRYVLKFNISVLNIFSNGWQFSLLLVRAFMLWTPNDKAHSILLLGGQMYLMKLNKQNPMPIRKVQIGELSLGWSIATIVENIDFSNVLDISWRYGLLVNHN